jgi:rod shape-determining protein MreC
MPAYRYKRIKKFRPHAFFIFFLLMTLGIPKSQCEAFRGKLFAGLSPYWHGLEYMQALISSPSINLDRSFPTRSKSNEQALEAEVLALRLLNTQLNTELIQMLSIIDHQKQSTPENLSLKKQDLVAAKVIFRSANTWNHSLWINIGEDYNKEKKENIICKNSPVVFGQSLIGIIDFVGTKQSRIQLITDPRLLVSVRATRGKKQYKRLKQELCNVIDKLQLIEELPIESSEKSIILDDLSLLMTRLDECEETDFLLKGEIRGYENSKWKSSSLTLKGKGFNCDFADALSPTRSLQTGLRQDKKEEKALVQKGDLLITTGMDGLFPPDLELAIIDRIYPLKEGAYSYDLDAVPTAVELENLSYVFVLPPVS